MKASYGKTLSALKVLELSLKSYQENKNQYSLSFKIDQLRGLHLLLECLSSSFDKSIDSFSQSEEESIGSDMDLIASQIKKESDEISQWINVNSF